MMRKAIDLTNKQFGKLFVVGRFGKMSDGHAKWLCDCSCGNQTLVASNSLKRGDTRSCGCSQGPPRLPSGEAAFRQYYAGAKYSAKTRGYLWDLSREVVRTLTKGSCFYCGEPPAQIQHGQSYTGDYVYNGIDRVDNALGYISDNVVSCCKRCNRAKDTRSVREFREWIDQVHYNIPREH